MGKIGGYLSQLKLSNFFAGLIIFFSATQLGLHFWPLSSLVYGIRIDYLSPTLYFLDVLITIFLCLQGLTLKDESSPADSMAGKVRPYWNLIVPILLVNLLYSQNPFATLSWSLHFSLYLLFFLSLPRIYLLKSISYILTLSLLFQFLFALAQVFLGHSVGGLLYYVGERSVAVGSPGIALGSFMGEVVLRAYGTFGHPNVLAGWSVVVLLITIQLRKQRAIRRSDLLRRSWPKAKMFSRTSKTSSETRSDLFGIYFPLLLTICIIFLTQSRAALIALLGIITPLYLLKNLKSRLIYFFVSLLVCWFVFPSLLTPPRSDLSLSERLDLQGVSLKVIQAFPIFGTGAQASISTYPTISPQTRLLQPDHNTFTLFLSWFGIFGVLAILYSLRPFLSPSIYLLSPLLPLLALDHYFLTSPQGLFIFTIYLPVALNYSHVQNHR